MDTADIPASYQQWRHCITVTCAQPLTLSYIEARIAALQAPNDHMTTRFVALYGEAQRQQTLVWFKRAREELQVSGGEVADAR
ncbi:hypothetical protein [Pseudomonas abyssi]|uniref:Uncharacterized protein n=1 Tax=Pseudomonas abyssi TaxID=170540 RepID=A0A395R2F1_9PSED|nr:hypothetical protein [Halopseudomonas gallaeciensis]RGP54306.1 hypothetical protein ASB58_10470 [Halopseudomonas gallaeciensis]